MLGIMTFGIKIKTEFLTVFKSVKVFQFSNLSVSVLRYKEHLLPPLKPKSQTLLAEFIPSLKEWVYPAKSQHSNDLIQLATLLCCSVLEAYFNTILLMCLLALSFHYFFQSECSMIISTMADQTHKTHRHLEKKQKICQDSNFQCKNLGC